MYLRGSAPFSFARGRLAGRMVLMGLMCDCVGCVQSRSPRYGDTSNGRVILELGIRLDIRLDIQLGIQLDIHFSACSRTQKAAFLTKRGCSLAVL